MPRRRAAVSSATLGARGEAELVYCLCVQLARPSAVAFAGSLSASRRLSLSASLVASVAASLAASLVGCGGAPVERYVEPTKATPVDPEAVEVVPTYSRQEMERVLAEERQAHTAAQAVLASLMEQRGRSVEIALKLADVGVQARYLEGLEACRARGVWCPPKLGMAWTIREEQAVPVSLDAEVRFDLTSWRALASELWARGCDCRSMTCVDAMTQTIDELEKQPMPEVQGDPEAAASITAARTCLWRLRGKAGKRGLTVE